MADPPPLIRCSPPPPTTAEHAPPATATTTPPSQRVPSSSRQPSRAVATAFHKRKSKHVDKSAQPPVISLLAIARMADQEEGTTNGHGHAVGVVAPGQSPIEQWPGKEEEEEEVPAVTIRKRIKFIMGNDEEEEEKDFQQPEAKEMCKKKKNTKETCPDSPPELLSNPRLRPSRSQSNTDSESLKSAARDAKRKKRGMTSNTTSGRTRSRFFSRFNKRTIRAVVLLVVKLCGLLVASILIPSSKQLVTAVNSGFDDSGGGGGDPSSDPPSNLDDLLDEYGDPISPLDGFASSTIIAISLTNGNYPVQKRGGRGEGEKSNTRYSGGGWVYVANK